MKINTIANHFTVCGALLLGALTPAGVAHSQAAYPSKSIQVVMPLQAGSGSDTALRTLSERLSASMGQPLLVENLTGAGGIVGAGKVARSQPEGYVLGAFNNGVLSILPHMGTKLDFEPLTDFEPVGLVANIPSALVVPAGFPAKTVAEYVAQARAASSTKKLNYASAGVGSVQHIGMEMLKSSAGFDMMHIPYKGGVQAVLSIVTGETQGAMIGISAVLPFIKSGKLRALAVGGNVRSSLLPGVPTMQEAGIAGYFYEPWLAVYAPKGTPRPIIMRLNAEITKALSPADVKERFLSLGLEVSTGTPEQLAERARVESDVMAKIIKQADIRGE